MTIFKHPQSFEAVQKLKPGCHIEPRLASSTDKQLAEYCKKADSREEGPYEFGELPAGQGARTDLKAVIDLVRDDAPLSRIYEEHPSVMIRYGRGVRDYKFNHDQEAAKEWRKLEVHCFVGPPGCGKDRTIRMICDGDKEKYGGVFFFAPETAKEWWDGYNGENTVHIMDYNKQLIYQRLLQILDGHPLRLPTKGGHTNARYKYIFMSTNTHPNAWYNYVEPNRPYGALKRRIHALWIWDEPKKQFKLEEDCPIIGSTQDAPILLDVEQDVVVKQEEPAC